MNLTSMRSLSDELVKIAGMKSKFNMWLGRRLADGVKENLKESLSTVKDRALKSIGKGALLGLGAYGTVKAVRHFAKHRSDSPYSKEQPTLGPPAVRG